MTTNTNQRLRLKCIATMSLVLSSAWVNADPLNLESGLPLEVEDAYPAPFMNREYQTFLRYQREHDGVDAAEWVNRLELGLWYNTELTVEVPFIFGEVEPDGLGDVSAEILYNLNQETRTLPALSIAGALYAPTGDGSEGWDPELELIATKTMPGTWDLHRFHLNVGYRFNDDVQPDERGGAYSAVAGYEVRATNELVLLADLVRKEELEEDVEVNLFEVGGRYRLTPFALMAAGIGFGFGDESPDARTTLGLQLEF